MGVGRPTASAVLASSLRGDVRRIDRSQRVREAIILGTAVGLAAGAAQAIQLALMEKLEGASVLYGIVPLIALAAFACGAVIGFKVPVAWRINLMTPIDPIMARALRDLLAQAKVALGSETAAKGTGCLLPTAISMASSRRGRRIQGARDGRGQAARGRSGSPARGGPKRATDASRYRGCTRVA